MQEAFCGSKAPGSVWPQTDETFAPSEIKLIAVPSGTELPKRSEAIIFNVVVAPSFFQPSILKVPTLSEKEFCAGNPVVIVRVLDWLLIVGLLVTVATTQAGVGTVPDRTKVFTYPSASDVAVAGANVIPIDEYQVESSRIGTFPLDSEGGGSGIPIARGSNAEIAGQVEEVEFPAQP